MKIGIIGHGHIGSAMKRLFTDATIYDVSGIGSKEEVNKCDVAFICVPTPQNEDGSCDTSIVESVIKWCECNVLIIRSTVRVGFTDEMCKKYNKKIVFQPEYYGETVAHPFANLSDRNWLTFGGTKETIAVAIDAYKTVINSDVKIYQGPAKDAEMAKYMTNTFLAAKVVFVNEMYEFCKKVGADYNLVRDMWIADPRIGSSHTFVYENNRGYGGSCFPKDTAAIQHQGKTLGADTTIIDAVINKNDKLRKLNKK